MITSQAGKKGSVGKKAASSSVVDEKKKPAKGRVTKPAPKPAKKAAAPNKNRAPASLSAAALVCETEESPYDRGRPNVRKTRYANQVQANAAVIAQWNTYKKGYQLQECRYYENGAGFVKAKVVDLEGTVNTWWSCPAEEDKWKLVKTAEKQCGYGEYNEGTDDEMAGSDEDGGKDDVRMASEGDEDEDEEGYDDSWAL